jgi:hypothetical protein
MELYQSYIPYIIPLILVQITLQALSLFQLFKPETHVRGGKKMIWGIVIVAFQLLGVLVFHLAGKLPPSDSEDG